MRITLFGQKRQTEINPSVLHPIFRSDRFIPPPAEAGEFSEAMLKNMELWDLLQEQNDETLRDENRRMSNYRDASFQFDDVHDADEE